VAEHESKFPDWVKYTNPAELIRMANQGDGIAMNFINNHPLGKFWASLGSFEQVPTARQRTAQGTSERRNAGLGGV
jgi:hypothetical protein